MSKDELIEYIIRTSQVIKEEKITELIDYFRKKQERIEYLERSNNRREDTILEQRQEISDLEDKIDKAIEYINKVENMKFFISAFGYGEFIGALEDILKRVQDE